MMAFQRQDSHVTISLSLKSKNEKRELRRKLQSELDLVRNWVKKIERNDFKLNGVVDSLAAKSTNSEVASLDPPSEPKASRSVLESHHGFSDNTGKEKRPAKGNLLYRNSEVSLAKDKLPPAQRKKKLKTNAKHGFSESAHEGKFSDHTLKNCVTLLDRLMKHKHGWVFNEPVDPKNLGLTDYFDIIKFPMDLCTVKNRLNTNWYKSPREFAEDVRLTFRNALIYNPKGQDVHSMAEQLFELFENKWAIIEADYKRGLRPAVDCEVGLPTSKSRTAPLLQSPLPEMIRTLERSESTTNLIDPKSNIKDLSHSDRKSATKKNKTKFLNKRDMTYEEKEKLSMNLQNLPSEKLDNVVQIIKRRAPSLCHNDDEIEVDIDSIDAETLWELDRFVTNYHKSLSKNKRKVVHSIQSMGETDQNAHKMVVPPVIVAEESEVAKLDHEEKHREKRCRLSSSSSDSESSSSDSDRQSSPG